MPFNLRGGRPKNMKQGTYWVQRHQADKARRNKSVNAQLRQKERYDRIFGHLGDFANGETFTTNEKDGAKILELKSKFDARNEEAKSENYSRPSVSRFATSTKNLMVSLAKSVSYENYWDSNSKILYINGKEYDFS